MLYYTYSQAAKGAAEKRNTIYMSSEEDLLRKMAPDSNHHADESSDMADLIAGITESYKRYDRVLVVKNREEVAPLIDTLVEHKTDVLVANESTLFCSKNLTRRSEQELYKNQFKSVDDIDLAFIAKLFADMIPVRFTRNQVVANILNSNDQLIREEVESHLDAAIKHIDDKVRKGKRINHPEKLTISSIQDAYEYIKELKRGVVILKAPTASGKSFELIYPLLSSAVGNAQKAIHISHRRSIAANEGLSGIQGLIHYQSVTPETETEVSALNVVVNSLVKWNLQPATKDLDFVFVDEATQTLNHIFESKVERRAEVFNKLKETINSTDVAVLADADADDTLLDFVHRSGRDDVTIIEMPRAHTDIQIRVGDYSAVSSKFLNAVHNGETCILAIDNKETAVGLAAKVQDTYKKKVLLVTSDNINGKQQKAFIKNPNRESKKYDVVIFSPVITSNLSITNNHFSRVFGLFSGVVSPSDAIQMLRRIRAAKVLEVGVKGSIYRDFGAESESYQRDRYEAGIQATQFGYANEVDVQNGDLEDKDFMDIAVKIRSHSAFLRNHFIPAFVSNAEEDGFEVLIDEYSEVDSKNGKSILNSATKLVDALYREKMLKIINNSDGYEFDENSLVASSAYLSEYEDMKQELASNDLAEEDLNLWSRGALVEKLENIEIALMSSSDLKVQLEMDSHRDILSRSYVASKRKFFDLFKDTLNLDLKSGEGSFTSEHAFDLLNSICDNWNEFNLISEIKVTEKWRNSSHPVRTVKKLLLKFFNLDLVTKQNREDKRSYILNDVSYDRMMDIIERRARSRAVIRNE
ncbi:MULTISPECIES: plasmid replication protein, CyRepA1 family [unclassified Marinobacterium]|uniref:plasmid replication protein, CyRepA1 family n=1 Tax=unclassified Marinobacterium TaxID=2644139 RepID=UPI001568DAF5|nr:MULTISPECIES: plasmid replication protein, CyRepA1 family [unclassified Marinobacterium]NRP10106.1 Origin of replication binding protein [Marinobacterium sp. xm-g-48]NRP82951.1 Origin of replication binding protein [Marinobacterium sp. xm-d-509]